MIKKYYTLDECLKENIRFPEVTIHGRFQPPIHRNHYETYIANAFKNADHVKILITNPYLNEPTQSEATHRNVADNNPLTYDERVYIFENLLTNLGVARERYSFAPFDITDETTWAKVLDKNVPNLVNTYSPWSQKKLDNFQKNAYIVIHSQIDKKINVSGTRIRNILFSNEPLAKRQKKLLSEGLLPQAMQPLFEVCKKKYGAKFND